MRRAGIKGLPNRRRPRPRHDTPTALDLIDRNFSRPAPSQLWVTDIERHEALLNRVEVGDLHRRVVAAAR
jgi:putative transposase